MFWDAENSIPNIHWEYPKYSFSKGKFQLRARIQLGLEVLFHHFWLFVSPEFPKIRENSVFFPSPPSAQNSKVWDCPWGLPRIKQNLGEHGKIRKFGNSSFQVELEKSWVGKSRKRRGGKNLLSFQEFFRVLGWALLPSPRNPVKNWVFPKKFLLFLGILQCKKEKPHPEQEKEIFPGNYLQEKGIKLQKKKP